MAQWSPETVHQDIRSFSDDIGLKKKLRNRRIAIIGVLFICFAGIAIVAKPAYKAFRTYQIDRNLENAKAAEINQNWGDARNLARSVLIARPSDFTAFHIWFRALSEMKEPRTYLVAAQLFTDGRASHEDKMEALRVMSLQAPQALALAAYASLPQDVKETAAARASLAEVLIFRGELDFAERILRGASGLDENPRARFLLLRVLCAQPNYQRVVESRNILAQLIKEDNEEEALAALRVLGEIPGGLASGEPLPSLVSWIEKQSSATPLDHMLALQPAIADEPEKAEEFFSLAIERFRDIAPAALGSWLVRRGKHALAAEALEDIAPDHPQAFIARIHALLRLKNFEEVDKLLTNPPAATDAVELELIHVAVARGRGANDSVETLAWNRAMTQASLDTSRNRFLEVARYAELYRAGQIAEDAWVAAIRVGWGRLPIYHDVRSLIASLGRQNRSYDILSLTRSLLRYEGHNPELHNNYLYLGLLHDVINPQVALKGLEELAAQHPEMPEIYSSACMAALKAEKPEKAMEWFELLEGVNRVSPMMLSALKGTALILMGQQEDGRKMLESVDYERFLSQENLVLRELLVKQQISGLSMPSLDQLPSAEPPEETPAWKKAVELMERERASETLPALPMPEVSGGIPVSEAESTRSIENE